MVLSSPKSKRPQRLSRQRPNASAPPQNPTRRRATTGRVPVDENGDPTLSPQRSPTSPSSSHPLPQTKTSPSPPSDRQKPVRRLPSQPRPSSSKQEDGPPFPATPQAPPSQDASKIRSLRSRDSKGKGKTATTEEKPRVAFSISLTEEEINNDFIAMTGSKPPRRPKRRQKSVQRDINATLPGFQLPKTVTPERYRVPGPSR